MLQFCNCKVTTRLMCPQGIFWRCTLILIGISKLLPHYWWFALIGSGESSILLHFYIFPVITVYQINRSVWIYNKDTKVIQTIFVERKNSILFHITNVLRRVTYLTRNDQANNMENKRRKIHNRITRLEIIFSINNYFWDETKMK